MNTRATRLAAPAPVTLAVVAALLLSLWFVADFIGVLLFAALTSILTNAIYKWFRRRFKNKDNLAVFLTLLVTILIIIIPLAAVVYLLFLQAQSLLDTLDHNELSGSLSNFLTRATDKVNAWFDSLPFANNWQLSSESVLNSIKDGLSALANGLVSVVTDAVSSVPALITKLVLFFYLFIAMLKHQDAILRAIHGLSPFNQKINNQYFQRIGAMANAMVRGQLVIALADGLVASFSLYIVGLRYFAFFFVVLSFLSFIPLGAGIVTIPIGIVLLLSGNIWQGIFVILVHLLVVSNIDNVGRPLLVSKQAYLNSALLMLSVFAGIGHFGLLGVVYGPILMIVVVTTIKLYLELRSQPARLAKAKT